MIIPDNLKVITGGKEYEVKFVSFLLNNPLKDPQFGVNYETLKICKRLRQICIDSSFELMIETDLEFLKKVIQYPTQPYDLELGLQFLPFMDAIINCNGVSNVVSEEI